MPVFEKSIEFCDSNLDSTGRISIAKICDDIQCVATGHADSLGVGMLDLQKNGLTWMMTKLDIIFNRWPDAREKVKLSTWPSGTRGHLLCYRDFKMEAENGDTILYGRADWVIVDFHARHIVSLTPEVIAALETDIPKLEIPKPLPKISTISKPYPPQEIHVRRADTDVNKHVNNIHYAEWIFEPLPEEIITRNLKRMTISYRAEAHAFSTITAYASIDDAITYHTVKKDAILTQATCLWE